MPEADRWGVFVDELKIFAAGSPGADWWALYVSQQPGERVTHLAVTPSGGHVHVACDSEDDAEMLLGTITDHGINQKHMKVATLAACQKAALISYNQPAPLDAAAVALIAALRAAPEGDVLWTKEGDAWWIARNAPMDVLLRAGDLLRIPHLDYYSQIALADEVTRAARGPAIASTVDSTVDLPGEAKPGSPETGDQLQAGAEPGSLDDLGLTYPAWQGDTAAAVRMTPAESRRDEAEHAGLQQAARLEPVKTANRYVVARINKTHRTLGERPGPQHVGKAFVPYDNRHLSKEAAEESAKVSNDRYRPDLHGKTFVAVRAEPIPGTNKFRNLDYPSLTSKATPAAGATKARRPTARRTTAGAVTSARRARTGGPR